MVTVEVPEGVYRILLGLARRLDLDVWSVVLNLVVRDVDPGDRVRAYLELHEAYLREAEELHARGDLAQAGEKYWGAVTALLNAVAEQRGLPHYSHGDLWNIVETLVGETGNPEYSTLFSLAERLHSNFYHNFMRKESFERHREGVLKLIEMLRKLVRE